MCISSLFQKYSTNQIFSNGKALMDATYKKPMHLKVLDKAIYEAWRTSSENGKDIV